MATFPLVRGGFVEYGIEDLAGRIASSSRVVALTGAGISAESGISTFRETGGIWDRFDPDEVASAGGWMGFMLGRPWDAVEFLTGLRDAFADARPNAAHAALASLEALGHLTAVVTQNVDGLHREAGSRHVVELHGSFSRRRCMGCGRTEDVGREAFLASLETMIRKLGSFLVSDPAHLLERCDCGGLLRADVVLFGEAVQHIERAHDVARSAEVMIVCGTSGVVYPAAALPETAREAGAMIIEVNPEPTPLSTLADVRLRASCGEVLPAIADAVRRRIAV